MRPTTLSPGRCGPVRICQCRTCSRCPTTRTSHLSGVYPLTFDAYITNRNPPQGRQGDYRLGYDPRGIVLDPTQTVCPDRSTHQPHAVGQPAVEDLRQLASRYVRHPGSKVDMVRMEPGTAGRYKVVIVLEMSDLP
jgi:hypothetical protein